MQIVLVMLCNCVHSNATFTKCRRFLAKKHKKNNKKKTHFQSDFKVILVIESNIRTLIFIVEIIILIGKTSHFIAFPILVTSIQ